MARFSLFSEKAFFIGPVMVPWGKLRKFNSAAAAASGKSGFFEIWGDFQASVITYFAQHPEETL